MSATTCGWLWQPMMDTDVDVVAGIDQRCYSHPWTPRQFLDSLRSGHRAMLRVRALDQCIAGYSVAMAGVDEWHLLNLSVCPELQGQGHAQALLQELLTHVTTCEQPPRWLWLEVRQSNARALRLYEDNGFERVSLRPAYYPVNARQREAAVVMRHGLAHARGTKA